MLNQPERAYHESKKALGTMVKLNALRKERSAEDVAYESLLAPFYFKAGDLLLNYIQLNTDELGTVIPMQEDSSEDEEEEEEEEESCEAENQEGADQETPNEESKEDASLEEQKSDATGPQVTVINTTS